MPGGSGTQYLLSRVGRNRALEIVLGADLFDAQTALPQMDLSAGMLMEHWAWASQVVKPAAGNMIRGGLAAGAKTREGERRLEELMRSL